MIIQKAHSSDVDRIVSFYEVLTEKLAKSGYDLPWRVGIYPTREQFEAAVARQSLYLCTEQDTIIGAAILNHEQGDGYDTVKWECTPDPDEIAVVHLLCTDPDLHRCGVGTRMIDHLIREAKASGIKSLRLDVLYYNKPAAKLYEKAGFSKRGEVQLCYATTGLAEFWLYELVL